jgi:predicted methyltransferase
MRGKLTGVDCKWTTPYKQGKTTFRTSLMNNRGDVNEATIVIEGKDGKLTVTAVAKEHPDRRVRVPIDNYEEKN